MPDRIKCIVVEDSFELIIDSFLRNKVGCAENFLDLKLSLNLQKNLLALYASQQFKDAGIGNNSNFNKDELIRRDKIYWLDRKHEDVIENNFFDLIDRFVEYLNLTCYTGITGYEFHYALFEKGSFYKRHLDQFKNNKERAYSMIFYLNIDWKKLDGGELHIYHPKSTQIISPDNRKCVFFKSSELEHEVLMTHNPRLSITGWLKTN